MQTTRGSGCRILVVDNKGAMNLLLGLNTNALEHCDDVHSKPTIHNNRRLSRLSWIMVMSTRMSKVSLRVLFWLCGVGVHQLG